ncbi:MAG: CopG family transcriptional regulator [Spirochaetales bacterium]|nr:CopG family transcriptional regulator [Spirochaetales bacterium]
MSRGAQTKDEVITFKVEPHLAELLRRMPNRSQFIRSAILSSLDHLCPLCQGLGILSPDQKRHWEEFAEHHGVAQCEECGSVVLLCDARKSPRGSRG